MHYLRVVFAPGVVPGKWFGRFDSRVPGWRAAGAQTDDPLRHVLAGTADIGIVRIPGVHWDGGVGAGDLAGLKEIGNAEMDAHGLHRVLLYEETAGVAVPADHPVTALGDGEPVDPDDLTGEVLLYRGVVPSVVRENLDVVAANVGHVVAPRPLLRSLNRRGVAHRTLSGGPATQVALVWRRDRDDEVVQQFVGTCRGRRASSSR